MHINLTTILHLTFCLLISLCSYLNALDTVFYVNTYPDLKNNGISAGIPALIHYLNSGFYEHRQAAPITQNTNFDWKYYVTTNKLNYITTEETAKQHYIINGHSSNLSYCQKFSIAILLHLYDLNLMDEFIDKINYFIKINNVNDFYIKVNVPIDSNLNLNLIKLESYIDNQNHQTMLTTALNVTPYHKHLINTTNYKKIYALTRYLQDNLKIHSSKIQIIFSENRGLDIGGFLLLLDQVIQEKLKVDYIIKLHSKSRHVWRTISSSFLNLRVNKLLRKKEFIYACSLDFNWEEPQTSQNIINLTHLLNHFKLPKINFKFAAGTMFIASSKFVDFFAKHNLVNLFNQLNGFTTHPTIETLEHAYERLFGYLAAYLGLRHHIIGYIEKTKETIPHLI